MNGVYIKKFNQFPFACYFLFLLLSTTFYMLYRTVLIPMEQHDMDMDMDILESIADLYFLSFGTICHSLFNLHFLEQKNVL